MMDARVYDVTAQQIAAGKLIGHEAFFMGPLYPYLLSLIYAVFGRDFTVVRIVQSLGGTATVLLTFVLGRMLFRPSVAFLAATLLALYGTVTFYDGLLLMAWLGTVLNMGALVVLVRASRKPSTGAFAIAGALIGLSALARANILMFVPVVVIWIVWVLQLERKWLRAGVFVGSAVALLLPATVHNYVVSREFIPVTSNAGFNFYLGNNADASGYFTSPPEIDFVHDPTTSLYVRRLTGETLTPGQLSRFWFARAFDDINEDPGREGKILAKKLVMFWNGYEAPQIENYGSARKQYGALRVLFVNFWWLAGLGIVGMLFRQGKSQNCWILYGFVGAYTLSIVLFFVTARYRVQIAPVMALFAAQALFVLVTKSIRTPRAAGAFLLALAVTLLATNPRLFAIDESLIRYREGIHEARRLSDVGQYQPALSAITKVIEESPDIAEGYVHRAIIHKMGKNELKAIEDYARALKVNPKLASVHYDLAQSLRRMNFPEEAIKEYQLAVEIEPRMVQAHNNLGITYRDLRMYEEASEAFRATIAIDPKYAKAYNNLGACLAEAGKVDEAISVLQDAARVVPDYPNTHKNLAMAYVSQKLPRPAIESMVRYLELVPGDDAARDVLSKLYEAVSADSTAVPGIDDKN